MQGDDKTQPVVVDPPAVAVDLMAALKESLLQAKDRRLAWADRSQAPSDSRRHSFEDEES